MRKAQRSNMVSHFYLISIGFVLFLGLSCLETPVDRNKEEWVSLFNGTNYEDWTPKFKSYELGENHKNRFVYADSLLSVRYTETDSFVGNFGHLYYKKKFSHYKLKAAYRFK